MHERSLRRFFDALISLSFVSPLALLGGCEGGPNTPPPFVALQPCPSTLWCDDATRFRPAAGIDYVELRAFTDSPAQDAGCVVSSVGTRCAGASDAEGCLRTLSTLAPTPSTLYGGTSFPGGFFGLASTAGDRAAVYPANREALPALVPIDSEQEAVLIVRGDHYRVDCAAPMEQSVRPIAGGYEVLAQKGSACGPGDDIYSVAIENEVEGCVRETFGALVGQWQAERAADASIRAALISIAADELRHAALSWRVRGWAHRELGRAARAQIRQEQRRAVRALREELQQEPPALLVRAAGLPSAAEALALADRMERELWSAASA